MTSDYCLLTATWQTAIVNACDSASHAKLHTYRAQFAGVDAYPLLFRAPLEPCAFDSISNSRTSRVVRTYTVATASQCELHVVYQLDLLLSRCLPAVGGEKAVCLIQNRQHEEDTRSSHQRQPRMAGHQACCFAYCMHATYMAQHCNKSTVLLSPDFPDNSKQHVYVRCACVTCHAAILLSTVQPQETACISMQAHLVQDFSSMQSAAVPCCLQYNSHNSAKHCALPQ